MRAQLADPDGKARKWRSSDCMVLPAGCGMAREPVEKKKKPRRKKRNANSASPASLSLGQWRQTVIGSPARRNFPLALCLHQGIQLLSFVFSSAVIATFLLQRGRRCRGPQ